MSSNLIILKLGGSVISAKESGKPVLRARVVRRLAKEGSKWYSNVFPRKHARLILLYGGGSFGHPLAHRYHLQNKSIDANAWEGIGRTIVAMRELGNQLADIFLSAGIPIVPLQTSSFAHMRKGRVHFTDISTIKTILEKGGVPLLGGDVVLADKKKTAIASADNLAVELSKKIKGVRLLFATDVDGVYQKFPPRVQERPFSTLDRGAVKKFLKARYSKITRTDVTGAMPGKLRALLAARGTTAVVFNGNARGSLADALSGKKQGTKVML